MAEPYAAPQFRGKLLDEGEVERIEVGVSDYGTAMSKTGHCRGS